jgi:tetratricopeptide (TPR) repeat protein
MYNLDKNQEFDSEEYLTPLHDKYSKMYERNPDSKVFAPLAEIYRKIGKIEKALSLLQDGIKKFPDYLLGYLGIAHCYFDLQQFNLAFITLAPLVDKNRENIRLLKLFGETCEKTDHKKEALDAYKYLLFLNPKDEKAAFKVRALEDPVSKLQLEEESFNFSKKEGKCWETVQFERSEILEKLIHFSEKKGDLQKTTDFVELSLSLNPDDSNARAKIKDLKKKTQSPNNHANKLLIFLKKIKERAREIQRDI